jgi:hypothetical protein
MLIAVNNCFTGKAPTDHQFSSQLIKRLVSNSPQHQFLFFTHDMPLTDIQGNNLQIVKIPALKNKLPLAKIIWARRLQKAIQRYEPNLLINLNPFLALPALKPQLLLADEIAVECFRRGAGRSARRKFLLNMRLARKIAVPSAHQHKLLAPFTEPLQKTSVVHAGPEWPAVLLDWTEKDQVKEKYAGGKEFFLVQQGRLTSHLLINVLKAFSLFKKRQQSQLQLLIPLVAIDKLSAFEKKLAAYKYREDVRILPNLHRDEIPSLIASAYAIIDPASHSHSRAYSLQAFESQTPLIISKTSETLVWTGEDAALVVDMEAPETIAAQMMLLYKDEHLRSRLVAAGNARLEIFNWENAAEQLSLCLEAVIQKS